MLLYGEEHCCLGICQGLPGHTTHRAIASGCSLAYGHRSLLLALTLLSCECPPYSRCCQRVVAEIPESISRYRGRVLVLRLFLARRDKPTGCPQLHERHPSKGACLAHSWDPSYEVSCQYRQGLVSRRTSNNFFNTLPPPPAPLRKHAVHLTMLTLFETGNIQPSLSSPAMLGFSSPDNRDWS